MDLSEKEQPLDLTLVSRRRMDCARTDFCQSPDYWQQLARAYLSCVPRSGVIGEKFEDRAVVPIACPDKSMTTMPRSGKSHHSKRSSNKRSLQEKLEAIKRVRNGETKAAVGRDMGVPESTLRGWCKSEVKIQNQHDNLLSPLHAETPEDPTSSGLVNRTQPDHGTSRCRTKRKRNYLEPIVISVDKEQYLQELDEATEHCAKLLHWMENRGSACFIFNDVLQVKRIHEKMKQWATQFDVGRNTRSNSEPPLHRRKRSCVDLQ